MQVLLYLSGQERNESEYEKLKNFPIVSVQSRFDVGPEDWSVVLLELVARRLAILGIHP